jgi:predicted transcriptional regulator
VVEEDPRIPDILPNGGPKKHDPRELCATIADSSSENPSSISAWAKAAGITRQTLQGYLPGLRAKGWIATAGEGSNSRQFLTEKGKEAARHYLKEQE